MFVAGRGGSSIVGADAVRTALETFVFGLLETVRLERHCGTSVERVVQPTSRFLVLHEMDLHAEYVAHELMARRTMPCREQGYHLPAGPVSLSSSVTFARYRSDRLRSL